MKHHIFEQLTQLQRLPHTDKHAIQKAVRRLQNEPGVVKKENAGSHFNTFLIPIHKQSHSIYLGHHIKANDWIPPRRPYGTERNDHRYRTKRI
ncbi:hypothetical protein HGA88_04515 [Candidatus Roizmanbacteria bacterium]|nr:hypothetical protein [Candidatus Roizmanbacteria bacterium]